MIVAKKTPTVQMAVYFQPIRKPSKAVATTKASFDQHANPD